MTIGRPRKLKRKRFILKRAYFNGNNYDENNWLVHFQHPAKLNSVDSGQVVYWLQSTCKTKIHTYVGISGNFRHRCESHNGLAPFGAKYTTCQVNRGYQWEPILIIQGFLSKGHAMKFERRWKQFSSVISEFIIDPQHATLALEICMWRLNALGLVLNQLDWSNDYSIQSPLQLTWYKRQYFEHFGNISVPKLVISQLSHTDTIFNLIDSKALVEIKSEFQKTLTLLFNNEQDKKIIAYAVAYCY